MADIAAIRARCSASVTDMVSNPAEYYRSQQILRDRNDLMAAYDSLATLVAQECSRQGCHCPGEITGECSFCLLSAELKGYVPPQPDEHR